MNKQFDPTKPYIFLSYSHLDKSIVLPVYDELIRCGYNVWVDMQDIRYGSPWRAMIASSIKSDNCHVMLCFISQNYLLSHNCLRELNYADKYGKKVNSVIWDGIDLPPEIEMYYDNDQQSIHIREGCDINSLVADITTCEEVKFCRGALDKFELGKITSEQNKDSFFYFIYSFLLIVKDILIMICRPLTKFLFHIILWILKNMRRFINYTIVLLVIVCILGVLHDGVSPPNNHSMPTSDDIIRSGKRYVSLTAFDPSQGFLNWNDGEPLDSAGNYYSSVMNYAIISDSTPDQSTHKISTVYRVARKYSDLSGTVVPHASFISGAEAIVRFYAGDEEGNYRLIYESDTISRLSNAIEMTLDITDAEYIKIEVVMSDNAALLMRDFMLWK